jgi:hypothetical protein
MTQPRVRQMGAGRVLVLKTFHGDEIEVNIGLTPIKKADGSVHVICYITTIGEHNPVIESVSGFQR